MHRRTFLHALALCSAAGAAALLPAGPVIAHSYTLGDIAIGHVWAPPSEPGQTGAPVYGPLFNQGHEAARLVGATSPAAEAVRFRVEKDGVVEWPDEIVLQPGKPLSLAPWRVHLWLEGLEQPLEQGAHVPVTLDFGSAGKKTVEVLVEPNGGH
jgi:copper(I)-binding protein